MHSFLKAWLKNSVIWHSADERGIYLFIYFLLQITIGRLLLPWWQSVEVSLIMLSFSVRAWVFIWGHILPLGSGGGGKRGVGGCAQCALM